MRTFLKLLTVVLLLHVTSGETCKGSIDGEFVVGGTCQNIDECTGAAISSNDCSSSQTCCFNDQTPASTNVENKDLTLDIFLKVVGDTKRNRALYFYFVDSMKDANIVTNYEKAAYLSQLIGESKYFKKIESVIMERDDDKQLGNTKKGDGITYRGRGGILTRGRLNYQRANNRLNGKNI